MDSKEVFLASLAEQISAQVSGSDDLATATRYIAGALHSGMEQMIRGSHLADRPAAELAAFIIDGSTVQLVSNLVRSEVVTRAAETHGTTKASALLVENLRTILAAHDRAMRILRLSGNSESIVQ